MLARMLQAAAIVLCGTAPLMAQIADNNIEGT
jgi:hypothetical protein